MINWGITRRRLLASTPILAVAGFGLPALGRSYRGGSLPWEPNDTSPPIPVRAGPWLYFTADEALAVEAIADRLIPSDDSGPGGKQAGCAVFIDRQLAGSFGDSRGPLHASAICERHAVAGAAIADRAEGALPHFARRARGLLQDNVCRQGSSWR